jgi:hypothetical protein
MRHLPILWNQRWRGGRDSFRPSGETIDARIHEVAPLPKVAPGAPDAAKAFVEEHHYSHSFPAPRERFGLFRRGELVGVAVFSVPCHENVLTNVFPDADASVELGRFVLLDEVPGMGETWFLARCLRALRREGYVGVISHSDPFPLTSVSGRAVFPGHVGTIYQAGNATYLGRTPRRTIKVMPDGRVFSARAISKIRSGERNWRTSAQPLVDLGAGEPPETEELRRGWVHEALARFTRTMRHPGNHRYAWSLHRSVVLPDNKCGRCEGPIFPRKELMAA